MDLRHQVFQGIVDLQAAQQAKQWLSAEDPGF